MKLSKENEMLDHSFRRIVPSVALIGMTGLMLFGCTVRLQAAETAGKQWPAANQVSIDHIDHSAFDQLLRKYVDENGLVNYQAWQASKADRAQLKSYLAALGQADASKPASREAKLAYWINAYNSVTIEGILRVYPTTSIRNHTAKVFGYNIWKNLLLHSGDQQVSLEHIEHAILRKMDEPRIHFAIVCASIGCPRLLNEAYTADQLETQLTNNTKDFFSRKQNLKIDAKAKTIALSALLSWFGSDFGAGTEAQLRNIAPYFPEPAKQTIQAGGFKVVYLDYDWDLNKQ